ncbi:MAG: M20 family metallopeptidase [bacterium]
MEDPCLELARKGAVDILRDLVRIPSYESEADVVDYLSKRYESLGIPHRTRRVAEGGRANITATWGEGERSLILNGHMDTVSPGDLGEWHLPPFGGEVSEGRMYGRGTSDAKGSLAAMVSALEAIVRSGTPLRGKLTLMAVACEEVDGVGTREEVLGGTTADAAIVGEPTGLSVHIAHKGVLRLEIKALGRAAHASNPREGINAISKMTKAIMALDELAEEISQREDPLLGRATLAVTTIEGGLARNVIPPTCTIAIDRRLIPSESPEDAQREIEGVLKRLGAEDREFRAEVRVVSSADAASTPADGEIVEVALRSREEILGGPSRVGGFNACCDMWHLANRGKIPTVILGPGDLALAHKTNEYIEIGELEKAAEIYTRIALNWLNR